jgi:hypothetical protein
VTVDDYHFLCAGESGRIELDGFFTTDEDGRRLDLFPISEALRYRLPFSPAGESVGLARRSGRPGPRRRDLFRRHREIRHLARNLRMGLRKGWLTQFVEGVLASPKLIRTETYADFHARANATRGIVYLPTTSYSEMNEWTLPAPQPRSTRICWPAKRPPGAGDRTSPFLRGGIWRNFLSRYPEANWMHKRMLGAVGAASPHCRLEQRTPGTAAELLHRAQANDAYWHGLFGGLYLPHLRRAVWNNLLKLEAALDAAGALAAPAAAATSTTTATSNRAAHTPTSTPIVRDDGLARW